MNKFENPQRLSELSPRETLIGIGLKKGDVFCDIGAGTGIFTVEAAAITGAAAYAVDTDKDMLEAISRKAQVLGLDNIVTVCPDEFSYPIEDKECDFALMCTVLHEIGDNKELFGEIKRILKGSGKLVVIEFHKKSTPMGPPEHKRLGIEQVKEMAEGYGFAESTRKELGENFYMVTFIHRKKL